MMGPHVCALLTGGALQVDSVLWCKGTAKCVEPCQEGGLKLQMSTPRANPCPPPRHPAACQLYIVGIYSYIISSLAQMRIAEISVWDSAGVKYTQGEFITAEFGQQDYFVAPEVQAQPISK